MTRKPHPHKGDWVKVGWRDIMTKGNGTAHTLNVTTLGRIAKWGGMNVLIESSWYDDKEYADFHDTIAIPVGCVDEWEILRERERKGRR